jgi:site-specific DNA-methyltransferase (adenine-specific)
LKPYASGKRWTLYAGDCLAVLSSGVIAAVDGVVTDPPYSSGGMTRGDRSQSTRSKYSDSKSKEADLVPSWDGDNRDQRSYLTWCGLWLGLCLEASKPGAPLVCFTDWRQLPITTDAVQVGGWVWRGIVPWAKPNARPQMGRFKAECEYAIWGSNGPMPANTDVGCLRGFYEMNPPTGATREHQTQKPRELMKQIAGIVVPGGVVLDPFTGSGSTGVGALAAGRCFVGVERSPAYLDIATRRLRQAEDDGVQEGLFACGAGPGLVE